MSEEMENYLIYGRVACVQMLKDIILSSDYVIDSVRTLEEVVDDIVCICKD